MVCIEEGTRRPYSIEGRRGGRRLITFVRLLAMGLRTRVKVIGLNLVSRIAQGKVKLRRASLGISLLLAALLVWTVEVTS